MSQGKPPGLISLIVLIPSVSRALVGEPMQILIIIYLRVFSTSRQCMPSANMLRCHGSRPRNPDFTAPPWVSFSEAEEETPSCCYIPYLTLWVTGSWKSRKNRSKKLTRLHFFKMSNSTRKSRIKSMFGLSTFTHCHVLIRRWRLQRASCKKLMPRSQMN